MPRPIPSEPLVRGKDGDYWADVVLGQPNFSEMAPNEIVPFKVFNPGGAVVDRSVSPGRAYVWDGGNNRVLGIDLAKCYAGDGPCSADLVIGQPSPHGHGTCNGDSGMQNLPYRALATAETLCGTPDLSQSPWESHSYVGMAVDDKGNLYVPDAFNNRVLLYKRPFETDSVADAVWGQADFSGIVCNRTGYRAVTAESLCFYSPSIYDRSAGAGGWPARGVGIDADGNLWVADVGNNRVVRFPADDNGSGPAPVADLVLGQPDFEQGEPGTGLENMFAPSAVRFDWAGKLYVADAYNHRVLVFEPPFETGMAAADVLDSGLVNPMALEVDPDRHGMWVNYYLEDRVVLWDLTGEQLRPANEVEIHRPGGVVVDSLGNLLVVLGSVGQDVVRVPPGGDALDKWLFSPPGGFNFTSRREIRSARGVAAHGDQLVVSDLGRLMFWNGLEGLVDGQPADGVIGPESWVSGPVTCCGKIHADDAGRLWVISTEGRFGFIDVYDLPLDRRSGPVHTIWTAETSFPVLGTDAELRFGGRMFGLASVDGGRFIWVTDTDNHRVVRIRDPFTAPVVDVILGQTTPDGMECNRSEGRVGEPEFVPAADMLCYPGDVTVDRVGNLWVSDHSLEVEGNFRLLMYPAEVFAKEADVVLFAPSAAKVFERHGHEEDRLIVEFRADETSHLVESQFRGPFHAATFQTAFDNGNRMAVGFNMYLGGQFVGLYDDPLGSTSKPPDYLNDLFSMAFALDFDDSNNLYVGDINRARVLVFQKPFSGPVQQDDGSRRVPPAPLPDYPFVIRGVSAAESACILRSDAGTSVGSLVMTVEVLRELELELAQVEVRRVASADRMVLPASFRGVRFEDGRVILDDIWEHLWRDHPAFTAVARLRWGEEPVSAWSPVFSVANDQETCDGGPQTQPGVTKSRVVAAFFQSKVEPSQ